jgi:hypothetical protein
VCQFLVQLFSARCLLVEELGIGIGVEERPHGFCSIDL